MQKNTTEDFLRWVEAEKFPPPRFLFPSPNEAGFLAAVRLKFTKYRDTDIGPNHALARACITKGWLEARVPPPAGEPHPRRAPKPAVPPHEQLMLTKNGRAVLNAIIEIGWPVEAEG